MHRVEPEYPAAVRKLNLQGVVILQGAIDTDGNVTDTRVIQSPSETLTDLATAAIRQWRYKPALCDGKPVGVYLTVTTTFRLQGTEGSLTTASVVRPVDATCGTIRAPILIHRVEPRYPKEVRKFGVQGVVMLEGIIGMDGMVSDIRVLKSPSEPLNRYAIEALRAWRYEPALCDGRPVRVYLTVTTTFRLRR